MIQYRLASFLIIKLVTLIIRVDWSVIILARNIKYIWTVITTTFLTSPEKDSPQKLGSSSDVKVVDRSILKSSFSKFLESLLLPLRKEPPKDLLFIEMLSKSEDVEIVLKMTPPASGIELRELKEHREFRDSCEPFLTIVEIEQVDFPKDLVETAGLWNIKIVGKREVI